MPKVESSTKRCGVCDKEGAKYRCPACELRTCTLTCVKKHKLEQNCTGVKYNARYIPVGGFTETDLTRDYQFLEAAIQTVDNANRDHGHQRKSQPAYLNKLVARAGALKITLRLMPFPMSRRKMNKTKIHRMASADAPIDWMVEFIFPQAGNKTITDTIPFDTPICDAMTKHVLPNDPALQYTMKPYIKAGTEGYNLFMKAEGVPANKPQYYELDLSKTVTQNLSGKLVVEFPTVFVVLKENSEQYKEKLITVTEDGSSQDSSEDSEESSSEEEEKEEEVTEGNGSNDIRIAGMLLSNYLDSDQK